MNIDKYTENLKLASIFSVPAYKHQHYTTILGSSLYHQRQHVLLVLLLILLPIHSYGNWGGRVTPVYKKMQHLNYQSTYLTFLSCVQRLPSRFNERCWNLIWCRFLVLTRCHFNGLFGLLFTSFNCGEILNVSSLTRDLVFFFSNTETARYWIHYSGISRHISPFFSDN